MALPKRHCAAAFLDFATLSNGDIDCNALQACLPEIVIFEHSKVAELSSRLAQVEIVLCNKTKLDANALSKAKHLKLIVLAATGTNNVDLVYAKKHNIAVCNLEDYCSTSVAEHVLMLCLTLNRNLLRYHEAVRAGAWQEKFCLLDYPIAELRGKSFGVIGFGVLGQATAQLARAFGMHVLVAERRDQPARQDRIPFESVLAQADFLSLHCPMNDETHHLISSQELKLMRSSAVLINTARGNLVDSKALVSALRENHIAGAGIDVLPIEPPIEDDVLLAHPMPQLIVTPHIAWASHIARSRALKEMCLNVESFLDGGSRNRVV